MTTLTWILLGIVIVQGLLNWGLGFVAVRNEKAREITAVGARQTITTLLQEKATVHDALQESQRLLKITQKQRDNLNRENETLHTTLLKAMTVIEELQQASMQGEEQQV